MIAFEKVIQREKPDWVVVVGDVNATLACSITAKKEDVKVCHIEAGLRSGDMQMPEEINRLVTDRLSDLLLTPDEIAVANLRSEGVPEEKICFVGNIMIDTLEAQRHKASNLDMEMILKENLHPEGHLPESIGSLSILTMHRPSNVDKKEILEPIVDFLMEKVSTKELLLWPIHPRTQERLKRFGLWEKVIETPNIVLLHPLGYHEMLKLNIQAHAMLTDSGGLQEECCVLGTPPCMTLRWNTERPVTLKEYGGASTLVGNNVANMQEAYEEISRSTRKPQRPKYWDGHTAQRCLDALLACRA